MTPPITTRVIGIGQPSAGDDGVGPAVLDVLRKRQLPGGVELATVREASALLPLLDNVARAVVVDAGAPGRVHVLDAEQLDAGAMSSVSSHGIGVAQALELARALSDDVAPEVRFVAVTIHAPKRYRQGLSVEVETAIQRAVETVVSLL